MLRYAVSAAVGSLFCRNLCGSHDWNGRFSDGKNRDEIFRIVDRNRTGKGSGMA